MAYDSNKAAKETRPPVEGPSEKPSLGPMQSNQERGTGDGVRTVAVPTSGTHAWGYTNTQRELSNQVKIGPNGKGSTTLKDPLNTYASKTMPAVSNPSKQQDESEAAQYAKKAAGRAPNARPSL